MLRTSQHRLPLPTNEQGAREPYSCLPAVLCFVWEFKAHIDLSLALNYGIADCLGAL